jgi:hypothetical protein
MHFLENLELLQIFEVIVKKIYIQLVLKMSVPVDRFELRTSV